MVPFLFIRHKKDVIVVMLILFVKGLINGTKACHNIHGLFFSISNSFVK